MDALVPAAKFLVYAVAIYFGMAALVSLGVVGLLIVLAALNRR